MADKSTPAPRVVRTELPRSVWIPADQPEASNLGTIHGHYNVRVKGAEPPYIRMTTPKYDAERGLALVELVGCSPTGVPLVRSLYDGHATYVDGELTLVEVQESV